jgi:SAM-dependent methyltransferase
MISVFTPSHDPSRLPVALASLQAQTHTDWEWVILLNNGARWSCDDPRVKVFTDDTGLKLVGYLKRMACKAATGDVLLELDHDDWLLPTALAECSTAFADPEVVFAYSNSVCHNTQTDVPIQWSARYGWKSRPVTIDGKPYIESVSAAPDPQSISRIWFAPNHFRSWRTTAYWAVGGHDASMKISDDHDLMLRTWLHGRMVHIDKPLYFYNVHGGNTWLKHADEIERTMWAIHDRYIERMAEKWARERELCCVDVCCGDETPAGYVGIDRHHGRLRADLERDWPLADGSVGVIRAVDAVEHLRDPIHTMNEAHRVLAHGGFMFVAVPSTNGPGAWADPTHVSFWNRMSFDYYTNPAIRAYIEPAAKCRFQVLKLVEQDVPFRAGTKIPYVFAHLVAIKSDSPRFYGELLWENGS